MRKKLWVLAYLLLVAAALSVVSVKVAQVDPFFHYHKPYLDNYYYTLNNQRSQNDGIFRHFDYDAVITGSSMSLDFRTSEAEALFGHRFIKAPYDGATFYEVDQGLRTGFRNNPEIRLVFRSLDLGALLHNKDYLRMDLGDYPAYLYDDDPFNDVHYLFNRDVLFDRVYPMVLANDKPDFQGGITSFDDYAALTPHKTFGYKTVYPAGMPRIYRGTPPVFTAEEEQRVRDNIRQNIAVLALEHPEAEFYCYIAPLGAGTWLKWYREGKIEQIMRAKEISLEELIPLENVRVFDFSDLTEITADLNNYRDTAHFGSWISSLMLRWMHEGKYELTEENYRERCAAEYELYLNFDYASLEDQEDYENDYYAAALWREEITGIAPRPLALPAKGGTVSLGDVTDYRYLSFSAQKMGGDDLRLFLTDETGAGLLTFERAANELDGEWHRYLVDLDEISGPVTLVTDSGAWLYRDTILY